MMKDAFCTRAAVLCGVLLLPTAVSAQLLFETDEEYVNYARQRYRPYTGGVWSELRRPAFDELGNFIMDGVQIFRTEEGREREPLAGSLLDKSSQFAINLNRLVIAHDSYNTWTSRLMVGDRIRTKFTALTLDLVAFNGVRWDVDLDPTQFTVLSSRVDWPIFPAGSLTGRTSERDNLAHGERRWATYLLGSHLERQIGALNIGFNYVNLHRTDSLVGWGDNSLKGVLPSRINQPPAYIAVRVKDGAPEDGRGARVYAMHIEGELSDIAPTITRHDSEIIDRTFPNVDQFFPPGREIPPYMQFLKGQLPPENPGAKAFMEARGTEFLIFWFKIPQERRDKIESLRFRAQVSDDYHISLSEVFLPVSRESSNNPSVSGEQATYYHDVAAAEGIVQDQSNLRWITFDYGRQSGRTTTSVRLEFAREGLEVTSEYARSFDYRQYPASLGRRKWRRTTADAFFATFKKQLGEVVLGGEYFRIDPLYSTQLSANDAQYSSYTDDLESPFGIPHSFPVDRNNTVDLDSVDDNDDKDLQPDFHFLPHLKDGSVIPGRDLDLNGRVDSNENGNRVPDYLEPFFLYNADPPEYDYGDDLNNNNIIDHREDDLEPDYPYDVDLKGYHLFVDLTPAKALEVRLGRYQTEEIWTGGKNRVTYGKVEYERSLFPYGQVDFANYLKKVEDNIEDDTIQLTFFTPNSIPIGPATVVSTTIIPLVEDQLWMKDSVVNTAYVDGTFFKVQNLRINNRLKHTVNFQRGTAGQASNTIHELAWVLRGDYTYRRNRLAIVPKFKYMSFIRKGSKSRLYPISERFFYPMVTLSYALTTQTEVTVGAQGFPFLKSTYRDRTNGNVDYSSRDYIVTLTNYTTYEGQQLSLNMGFHLQYLEFEDRIRARENIDRSLFFIRLILGAEPPQG